MRIYQVFLRSPYSDLYFFEVFQYNLAAERKKNISLKRGRSHWKYINQNRQFELTIYWWWFYTTFFAKSRNDGSCLCFGWRNMLQKSMNYLHNSFWGDKWQFPTPLYEFSNTITKISKMAPKSPTRKNRRSSIADSEAHFSTGKISSKLTKLIFLRRSLKTKYTTQLSYLHWWCA